MKLGKLSKALIIFAGLVFFYSTALYIDRLHEDIPSDFKVYYKASNRMASHKWADIYSVQDGRMPFRYSPSTLILFTPLSTLPRVPANQIWCFLQAGLFALGLYFIYRTLKDLRTENPLLIVAITFLLVVRYYMDALFSGQIFGMMFAGFAAGLYFWQRSQQAGASAVLFLPVAAKLVPGTTYILALCQGGLKKNWKTIFGIPALLLVVTNLLLLFWTKSLSIIGSLWYQWCSVVLNDKDTYDARISRSQSFRSALLRWFGEGPGVERFWFSIFVLGIAFLVYLWVSRTPKDPRGKALGYSLAVLGFVILMPQSLPYAFAHLALPIAILLSELHSKKLNRKIIALVVLFFAFCSLPGTSVVGSQIADAIQIWSIPCLVVIGLAAMTARLYWKHSRPQ